MLTAGSAGAVVTALALAGAPELAPGGDRGPGRGPVVEAAQQAVAGREHSDADHGGDDPERDQDGGDLAAPAAGRRRVPGGPGTSAAGHVPLRAGNLVRVPTGCHCRSQPLRYPRRPKHPRRTKSTEASGRF